MNKRARVEKQQQRRHPTNHVKSISDGMLIANTLGEIRLTFDLNEAKSFGHSAKNKRK